VTARALALLLGDRGRLTTVEFREGEREFQARVSEDNLWGAVKDNLVLGEYERFGIELRGLGGVVVDAGGHVGLFSLLVSAHAGRVLTLEAHPANFALLTENVARNEARNVEPRHRALWRENGHVQLVEGAETSSGSIVGGRGTTFEVEAETLDFIVAASGPVDLLKLDIEGAEFDVLEHASDATLRQISAVVAELHLEGQVERLAPTVERLRRSGFTVVVRRPPIAYWRETMRALLRNRGRLRGRLRLRVAVLVLYSLVALARPFAGQGQPELVFLYATRVDPSSGPA
jgi:FkbM family methyltransferase